MERSRYIQQQTAEENPLALAGAVLKIGKFSLDIRKKILHSKSDWALESSAQGRGGVTALG